MEKILNLHLEKLPEGFYLATSDSISGLIAQGRTIAETFEIARNVAKKLLEAQDQEDLVSLMTSIFRESARKHQEQSASVRRQVSRPARYFPFQFSSHRFSFHKS